MTPPDIDQIRGSLTSDRLTPQQILDISSLLIEVRAARDALDDLNKLRSNVVSTQSASWSNLTYPMVAILNRAGYEVDAHRPPENQAAHLLCYGGAGGSPNHPKPDMTKGSLYQQRLAECREAKS